MSNTQDAETELTANNNEAVEDNTEPAIELIENPKWREKIPFFDEIPESLRDDAIKSFNKYERLLDEINSRFFVSYFGGKSLIYRIPEDINDELKSFSHNEFRNHYGHRTIPLVVNVKNGKLVEKEIKYAMEWMKHKNRKQYTLGLKFYPGQMTEQDSKHYYNSWRGFPIEGKKGEFPKIEYHLKHVWCRDNIDHYNYLMAWLADIIQNPAEKKGTALVVKGGKGSGKSIIFEELLKKIFGYTYIKIDKAEQITGKFNQHLHGKLFVLLEEAVWAGDKTAEGTLKSTITDTEFLLEGKGTNAERSEAYFRMAFISNEKQSVPATKDERRFFALKVSDEYRDNIKYFEELVYEIRNEGIEAFMYHLQHLDIRGINLRVAPITEALFDDILAKMETVERFLYDLLHKNVADYEYLMSNGLWNKIGINLWGNTVTKSSLFKIFEVWEHSIKTKNIYLPKHDITTQYKLTRDINNLMHFKNVKDGTEGAFILPPLEAARKTFEENIKSKVIWLDDESDTMVDAEYERQECEMNEILAEDTKQRKIDLEEKQIISQSPLGKIMAG